MLEMQLAMLRKATVAQRQIIAAGALFMQDVDTAQCLLKHYNAELSAAMLKALQDMLHAQATH